MVRVNRATAGTARTDPKVGANDVLRLVLELFAFVSLGLWGFLSWDLPWSIVFGVGAPVLAILLWALFLSPRAVLAIDQGTTGTTCLVIDADGRVVGRAYRELFQLVREQMDEAALHARHEESERDA